MFGKRKKYSSLSDDQLIEEYKLNQDNNCVGELYKRYTSFTFSICLKYLKNKELARDAVLDIFEDLLEKLLVHEVKNFRSWLYTVTKNHCLLKTRNKKLNVEFVENYEKHQNDFMEQERILNPDYIVKEENIQKLEKCIMQLKPEQKSCIELFFIQEKSYNEIVEITGFSYKEVKTHIQNGKRNLEILLKKIDEENK